MRNILLLTMLVTMSCGQSNNSTNCNTDLNREILSLLNTDVIESRKFTIKGCDSSYLTTTSSHYGQWAWNIEAYKAYMTRYEYLESTLSENELNDFKTLD